MDEHPRVSSDDIRYQAKAVDDADWIASFLADQPTGVLGLVDDGSPYVVTQLFVYEPDEHVLYLHGASAGRVHGIVDRDGPAEAAFTVSRMGRFIPHEIPMEFTVEYESVDVFGTIDLVTEDAEKRRALEQYMAEYAPHLEEGEDYVRISQETMDVTAVYRFEVDNWSGKRGLKEPDHPGAYTLDEARED